MAQKRILVVEDDDIIHITEELELQRAGYGTRWTDATNVAWQYLEEGGDALVILDVYKLRERPWGPPVEYAGLELLRRLRSDPRFTKDKLLVIGTSQFLPDHGSTFRDIALEEGVNEFVEIGQDDLVAKVNELLGGP
ncbi:MAG: hypothetical protein A2V70_08695 [Planctomycetes bacterium RBG_13_63_9]|nr:MAG: hypothetical protein A2V70_08695 [Planctomycetes bacterium RBG_13_63_9]